MTGTRQHGIETEADREQRPDRIPQLLGDGGLACGLVPKNLREEVQQAARGEAGQHLHQQLLRVSFIHGDHSQKVGEPSLACLPGVPRVQPADHFTHELAVPLELFHKLLH